MPRTRDYIERGGGSEEGKSLTDAMRDGSVEGMQTFDQVLEQMVRTRVISMETAMLYATNAGNLRIQLADFG